jgi:thioredoxin 1
MNIISFVVFFLFIALAAYLVFKNGKVKEEVEVIQDSLKIKTLNEHNFDHQIKRGVILVELWAPWCLSCKAMAPTINALAEEVSGNTSIGKLNIDNPQTVSLRYNVKKIPALLLFKNGEEVKRFNGIQSKEILLKEILKVQ